jgi:hypothetical protein
VCYQLKIVGASDWQKPLENNATKAEDAKTKGNEGKPLGTTPPVR